jgi:hypothetical protein
MSFFFMYNLPRGQYLNRLVAALQIHRIEPADFIIMHEVLEVPASVTTDRAVKIRDRSGRDPGG